MPNPVDSMPAHLARWEAIGRIVRTARDERGHGGFMVAEVPGFVPAARAAEYVALITAAPRLLAALRLVQAHLPAPECAIWHHVHAVMADAIAATGVAMAATPQADGGPDLAGTEVERSISEKDDG